MLFYNVKGHLLQPERPPFAGRKSMFYNSVYNELIHRLLENCAKDVAGCVYRVYCATGSVSIFDVNIEYLLHDRKNCKKIPSEYIFIAFRIDKSVRYYP